MKIHLQLKYIQKITPLILYFDKYILSKQNFRNIKCIQSHPYYMISSVLGLHPNYIDDLLMKDSNINEDIETITLLDKYTKENNTRNYIRFYFKDI